jgi:hypothetical protein
MPVGTAFFTGNATTAPTVSSNNGGTLIGNPHLTQRIMRPNEAEILGLSGVRQVKVHTVVYMYLIKYRLFVCSAQVR